MSGQATGPQPSLNGTAQAQGIEMADPQQPAPQQPAQPVDGEQPTVQQPPVTTAPQPNGPIPPPALSAAPFAQDTTAPPTAQQRPIATSPAHPPNTPAPGHFPPTHTQPASVQARGSTPSTGAVQHQTQQTPQTPTIPVPSINPNGSPTRVYINSKVTPSLLEGMKYVAANEPEKPLKWLADYLAQRSVELEGS